MGLTKVFLWSAIERFSVQTTQFVIGIILARLLNPSEYGILSIILIINSFLQIFIDSGFTKALIQKQKLTTLDINSVFIFNIFIGIVCYTILYFFAPFIQVFYGIESLALYIRVIGISLILNSLYAVIQTSFIIDLNFKPIAKVNLLSSVISGIIAIVLAYKGFSIWALIAQVLLKSLITLLTYMILTKRRGEFQYSLASLKSMFKFGSNVLYESLLNVVMNNLSAVFIGKLFTTKSLGFYTRGTQFADIAFSTFSSILDSVLLSTFSKISKDLEVLKAQFLKISKITAIILLPFFLLLALLAEPIIRISLTSKWLPAVPIMQFFAIARFISLLASINVSMLYALGRSDLVLRQQFFKIIIRILFIAIALPFGIYHIAFAELCSTIVHFFINTYYPGKILNLSGIRQVSNIFRILLASAVIVLVYVFSKSLLLTDLLSIILNIFVGGGFYVLTLKIFKVEEINQLLKKII